MSSPRGHAPRPPLRPPGVPPDPTRMTAHMPTLDGRIYRPDLLMIGSLDRNSGKTELACRIISRHAGQVPLAGLKVTTVERADGSCPRGGEGCGVCSSLSEPWNVVREVDTDSSKDTSRLLAAGAHGVYWLRVLAAALPEGAAGLLATLPPGWVGVCESNSLRSVVEPGLFLQVRAEGAGRVKKSARAVAHLADRIVVSDGRAFDLDLDRLSVLDGQWALKRDASAIVLEGGDDGERACGQRPLALLESLRAQFALVLSGPAGFTRSAGVGVEAGRTHPTEEWIFVCPPTAGAVPAGIVNAMFRRREGVDTVLVARPSDEGQLAFGLCRADRLPSVLDAHRGGAPIVERLAARSGTRLLPIPC